MNIKIDQSNCQKSTAENEAVGESCMSRKLRSLGLCLGASTVSIVHVEQEQSATGGNPGITENSPHVIGHSEHPHEGDLKQTLLSALEGLDLDSFDRITATVRRFREYVNLTSIPEPEAVEYAKKSEGRKA